MSRIGAGLMLAFLFAVLIWGLAPASIPGARRLPPPGAGDAALYTAVIYRLRAGDDYYHALGTELRAGNYPSKSVFNWRTPLHFTVVAAVSMPAATIALKLLTLAAILGTAAALARVGTGAAIAGTVAQMGALATAFSPDAAGVAELWTGVLIALSLAAYYHAQLIAGAGLGVLALFFRELAAPYCLVCGLLAIRGRRWREATLWTVAALAYAAYFAMHAAEVRANQLPGDLVHPEPWLRWNALQFTVSTVEVNGWLGFLPRQATVLYLVASVAGTASRSMPAQARMALLTYFGLFAIVGQPFNYYWGFMTAPLWAFGFAHAAEGFGRLLATMRATRVAAGGVH